MPLSVTRSARTGRPWEAFRRRRSTTLAGAEPENEVWLRSFSQWDSRARRGHFSRAPWRRRLPADLPVFLTRRAASRAV